MLMYMFLVNEPAANKLATFMFLEKFTETYSSVKYFIFNQQTLKWCSFGDHSLSFERDACSN